MPDPQNPSLGFLLHDAARAVRRRFEIYAADVGLTSSQWRLAAHLMRHGPMPQARLAEILEIEPISVSRLVDRMEQADWVTRSPAPHDRRVRVVSPTAKCEAAFEIARACAERVYQESMANLPEGTRAELTATLQKLIENLSEN
ncbi:MarR family transcriptional regulator [Thioclava sp. SK-1]|uniref:MarR family winged helix-turn-helix transcriptional regulator n=1 Tax=Thioclava sp. SK-1 TaxID=1889770 RepID=UPI00082615E4|nr:MarR family winged helix-turn-helix transcriptional regulator [Thioclava sp. SK-1]OCX60413.1 MarR family transcriptional regulator [Thioclava sp. SK-1]